MQAWEEHLERWQGAGIVDAGTAERIRAYEAAEVQPAGHRWQVLIALILGGILLGAGVLLFVAAHWDQVSPATRLLLVVGALALLHAGAVFVAPRFAGMATALHAVGTVGAGAAIAMVGQIFNMQEHWPAAVLLWALCAAAGWYFLRDQFQQVCLLLLAPAWLICEWTYRANMYHGGAVYLYRMIAVLAAVYLTAFLHSRKKAVWGILFTASAVALPITTVNLADGWGQDAWRTQGHGMMPVSLRVAALVVMFLGLTASWFWNRRSVVPGMAVVLMVFVLPWLRTRVDYPYPGGFAKAEEPSISAYALVAAVSVFLAWWGVREKSRALINYGIAMFALTVIWFYFSSLMDKLGRSLGLIGLGVLFLAGGWLLERMRRRLIGHMSEEAAV